jgi:hypothetical protein
MLKENSIAVPFWQLSKGKKGQPFQNYGEQPKIMFESYLKIVVVTI